MDSVSCTKLTFTPTQRKLLLTGLEDHEARDAIWDKFRPELEYLEELGLVRFIRSRDGPGELLLEIPFGLTGAGAREAFRLREQDEE